MTEMRYELAIERIENIKGENTVSEKYRDYFRTLADFTLLVDKLKEKIENGEYYKFSIEELECWNTHLYDDVLGEHYKTSYANPAFATEKFGIEYGRLLSFLYTELRGVIPYAFEKKTEYLDILFELFIEVYNQFEEEDMLKAYIYCCYRGLPEKDYVKMLSGNSMFLSMSAKIKAEMEEAKKENDLDFSDEKLITWKSENRRIDKKS